MRRSLFAALSLSALMATPGWAQQEINDERTTPVETADADGAGNADDIVIGSNGRVVLIGTPGPAVRVNSDNNLTTQSGSRIEIRDFDSDGNTVNVDGATGVQIDPGVTSDFSHSGTVLLDDRQDAADSGTDDLRDTDNDGQVDDPDGEGDGQLAQDQNKTGVLFGAVDADFNPIANQAAITGDATFGSSSSVTVQGQHSYGVRSVTDIDGDFLARGTITVSGENSTALSLEGDVSGDVEIRNVTSISPGGNGTVVDGDVGGGFRATGTVNATGYRTTSRLSTGALMSLFETEAEAAANSTDSFTDQADNLDSGSAILISGSITDGVFISRSGQIRAFTGGGAALEIRAGSDDPAGLSIGNVVLPDDFDSTRTDDDTDPDTLDYSIVSEGLVSSNGVFDGKNSTAFLIVGRDDTGVLRSVILGGDGVSNTGTISATAFDATAIAMHIGSNIQTGDDASQTVSADTLHNSGNVTATAFLGFEDDGFADPNTPENAFGSGEAVAIQLDPTSDLRRILNEAGTITASVRGNGQSAVAIMVKNDNLEEITNSGAILAVAASLEDGVSADSITQTAIDASAMTTGLSVVQNQATDSNGDNLGAPSIRGDVLFGSGDDRLELNAGTVTGDVAFGAGADILVINNATLNGAITDSDGDLLIDVTNGQITLTGSDSLTLREAIFRNGGELQITVDQSERTTAYFDASGDVTFEEGAELSVGLENVIGQGGTFEIISAGTLTFADEDTALSTSDAPFLYNASLARSETDNETLVLTLSLKTSEELGMNPNQAAAFGEALVAFETVEALGAAIANLRSSEAFYGAYDQLLPEYATSAIQFALASNDAASGALETRLRNARMAPDDLAGIWIQEFGYFADRSSTAFGPGYRGQGVGIALGIDRPAGPFYAVGVQAVGAASEIEEVNGFDEPMIALSGQLGAYAAMDLGGFDVSGSLALGYDHFETEREIRIGDFSALTSGDWSGWHTSASLTAGRDYAFGRWTLRPEAQMTFMALFESGYSETVSSSVTDADTSGIANLALVVDDRESSVALGSATLMLARQYGTPTSWWAPSVRVGYRGEFATGGGETTARFGESGNDFTLQAEELSNSGFLVGFGLSAGSDYSTFTFAYDADVRDDFVRHVARLVIRLTF